MSKFVQPDKATRSQHYTDIKDQQDGEKQIESQMQQSCDLDHFPPSFPDAEKHARASRCAPAIKDVPPDLCFCCGKNAKNTQLGVWDDRNSFLFMGQGFPLLFQYLAWVIAMLLVTFLVYGLYGIISNSASSDCINPGDSTYLKINSKCCVNQTNESNDIFSQVVNGSNGEPICTKSTIIPKTFCDNLIQNEYDGLVRICQDTVHVDSNSLSQCCQNFCMQNSDRCHQDYITRLGLPNKRFHEYLRIVQSILLLVFVIVFKFFMQIMRRQQKLNEIHCDKEFISPSDYTAMITHLPPKKYTEAQLRQALDGIFIKFDAQSQHEIVEINFAYQIHDYIKALRKKNKLTLEIRQAEHYYQQKGVYPKKQNEKKIIKNKAQLAVVNQNIEGLDLQIANQIYNKTTSIAFVTFKTKECKELYNILSELDSFLSKIKISQFKYYTYRLKFMIGGTSIKKGILFQNNLIRITRAPEPDDLYWENCGFKSKDKYRNRILSWMATLILLCIAFGLILAIKYAQIKVANMNILVTQPNLYQIQKAGITALSFAVSLLIIIVNKLIMLTIEYLGEYELHTTKTHNYVSNTKKMIYVQFVNSTLLVIATNVLINQAYFQTYDNYINSSQIKYQTKIAFQRNGGVIEDLFFIFLLNAILPPLLAFFDIQKYIRDLKKWKLRRDVVKGDSIMTQREANKLFEGESMDFTVIYSHILKSIWIAFFVASIIPLGLLLTLLGLITYYWVQKYLIVKRYARPLLMSSDLNKSMLDQLQITPFIFSLGSVWFDYVFDEGAGTTVHVLNFVALGLSSIDLFYPQSKINKYLFFRNKLKPIKQETYEEAYKGFVTDYARANPLTSNAALESYLLTFHQSDQAKHVEVSQKQVKVPLDQYANENSSYIAKMKGIEPQKSQDYIKKFQNMKDLNQEGIEVSIKNPLSVQRSNSQQNIQSIPQQNHDHQAHVPFFQGQQQDGLRRRNDREFEV